MKFSTYIHGPQLKQSISLVATINRNPHLLTDFMLIMYNHFCAAEFRLSLPLAQCVISRAVNINALMYVVNVA